MWKKLHLIISKLQPLGQKTCDVECKYHNVIIISEKLTVEVVKFRLIVVVQLLFLLFRQSYVYIVIVVEVVKV